MAKTVWTLEALEAKHGDALLLHYGPEDSPRLIVIDGGPAGVYEASLRPRLDEIRTARGGGSLEVRMLMVSHIDDDHIVGVLALTKALRDAQDSGAALPFDILTLWHNSFDDIVAKMGAGASELQAARFPKDAVDGAAIVASVRQGRQLRLDADALNLNMNSGFDELIHFDKAARPLNIGAKLKFTVLGPRKGELDALENKWAAEVKALLKKKGKKKNTADLQDMAADFVDKSIHNLSSIVVLAEFGGKRILLTGDARGDFILESLSEAKLLKNGRCKVDVMKVPHHGSHHNIKAEFFKAISADHYVFSADGKHGNPDPPTLDDLFDARPNGPYEIWMTNDVKATVKRIKTSKPGNVQLHVRKPGERSVRIELDTPISW